MLVCDFCGKPIATDVAAIAGPRNLHICAPCVRLSLQLIEERAAADAAKEAVDESNNGNGEV